MVIIDDILREMRDGSWGCSKCGDACDCPNVEKIISGFADRIEAACRTRTVYRVRIKPTQTVLWQTIGEPCNSLEEAEIIVAARNSFTRMDYATRIERREESEWETVKEVCRD